MPHETPTYPQYTNLALHDGLFDQLMAAIEYHLDVQWDKQRIRGDFYARTYLGSMESVLANVTQYLLGILLLEEKRDQITAETERIRFETEKLLPQQLLKLIAETALIYAQIDKINKEIEYIDAKIDTEVANVDGAGVTEDSLIGRQRALLLAQKLGFAGDLQAKTAKLHADYDAVFQSVQENPGDATLSTNAVAGIALALTTANEIKVA